MSFSDWQPDVYNTIYLPVIFDDQVVDYKLSLYGYRANSTTGGGLPLKVYVNLIFKKIATWPKTTCHCTTLILSTKQCTNWKVTLTEKVILGDVPAYHLTARPHHRVQNINEPGNNCSWYFFFVSYLQSPKTHYHFCQLALISQHTVSLPYNTIQFTRLCTR